MLAERHDHRLFRHVYLKDPKKLLEPRRHIVRAGREVAPLARQHEAQRASGVAQLVRGERWIPYLYVLPTDHHLNVRERRAGDVLHHAAHDDGERIGQHERLPDGVVRAEHLPGERLADDGVVHRLQRPPAFALDEAEVEEVEEGGIHESDVAGQRAVLVPHHGVSRLVQHRRADLLHLRVTLLNHVRDGGTGGQEVIVPHQINTVRLGVLLVGRELLRRVEGDEEDEHQRYG